MIRTALGRAAAAGAAATATTASASAHAHARSVRVHAGGTLADERTKGETMGIEDGWTVTQFQGEDILFTTEEVNETVNDMFAIASGDKTYALMDSDSAESIETIDKDADAVIDQANIVPAGDGLQKLKKMTNIMLSRPSIQREIVQAFQQEPELREMVQSLSSQQGSDFDLFTFSSRAALPAADPQVEDITDRKPRNLFQSIMDDIGRGLEFAGSNLVKAGQSCGNFLGRIGQWLRTKAGQRTSGRGEAEEEDMSPADRIVGVTLCLASAVVLVLLAKRVGVLRVFVRH